MTPLLAPVTFGLILSSRAFFNGSLALDGRRQLLAQLDQLGIGYRILPVEATRNGAVETREEADKYARFFRENRDSIAGIVVALPNFGDELGVIETINQADLRVPVLVQASNDAIDKVDLKSRRDAFCGKLSVCNNLYQYGIPFTDTAAHTCDIDSADFRADLDRFARICRVVKGLRHARIGCIGARTAAFQTVRFSEKLLQASGITSHPGGSFRNPRRSHSTVRRRCRGKDQVGGHRRIRPHPCEYPSRERGAPGAAFGRVERWTERNGCVASAIQCWSSLQENFGCASCLTMSMLGEKLLPSACEVDVAGAVSMYALTLAAGTPSALLDWNNNYGAEPDLCVCTHCGNFPKSFIGEQPEISNLGVIGTVVGPERCFGAIKGKVQPGPMTYFRISTDDTLGRIKAYVGEGAFTDHPFAMDGGIAVTRVPRLRELLAVMCRNGFEHHVAMVRGEHADVVNEAVSRYLNWSVYHHSALVSPYGLMPAFH